MTVSQAISWAMKKVGLGYVYGTYGQICTAQLLHDKQVQYPGNHNYPEARKWLGVPVYDCAGLLKAMRKEIDNVWQDISANGFYENAVIKDIGQAKAGDLLFRVKDGHAEHVGLCIAPGTAIEAKGTLQGVQETHYHPPTAYWTCCGTVKWITAYNACITEAVAFGVINSPEYWQAVLDGKMEASSSNVRTLMEKYNAKLTNLSQ